MNFHCRLGQSIVTGSKVTTPGFATMLSTIGPNPKASFGECPAFSLDPLETRKVAILVHFTYASHWTTSVDDQIYFVNGRVDPTEVSFLEAEIEKICRIEAVRHAFSEGKDPLHYAVLVEVRIKPVPSKDMFYPPPPGYKPPNPRQRSSSPEGPLFPAASPSPPPTPSSSRRFRKKQKQISRYYKPPVASGNDSSSPSSSSGAESFTKRKLTARKSASRATTSVLPVGEGAAEQKPGSGSEPSTAPAAASTDTAYWSEENDDPPAVDT